MIGSFKETIRGTKQGFLGCLFFIGILLTIILISFAPDLYRSWFTNPPTLKESIESRKKTIKYFKDEIRKREESLQWHMDAESEFSHYLNFISKTNATGYDERGANLENMRLYYGSLKKMIRDDKELIHAYEIAIANAAKELDELGSKTKQ